jgi:hypothetical protein
VNRRSVAWLLYKHDYKCCSDTTITQIHADCKYPEGYNAVRYYSECNYSELRNTECQLYNMLSVIGEPL